MRGKGRQFVPHGCARQSWRSRAVRATARSAERDPALVRRDLADGYVSQASARDDYGFDQDEIDRVLMGVERGEDIE